MKKKKRLNRLITIMMLFSMCITFQPVVYAATIPYSGIEVSSGHSFPINVVIGPNGKLYVAEYSGNKIVQMDRDGGNKTDYATGMSQPIGMVFDGDGNLYVAEHSGSKVTKVDSNGNKTLVKFISDSYLTGITLNSEGKIFFVGYRDGKIYKMNTDGSEYSEFVTGLPTSSIIGMTIDQDDNLYVSDRSNSKIRKIEPSGTVSDFLTNVSNPNWITLGKDGFFYVALGNRTIVKANSSGTIVETFSTETLAPWGISVDAGGYINFTEGSSTTNKIVGSAATSNTEQINLTMNTVLSSVYANPTAFSVSGVASNPEVIGATVSGSSINLTLSQGMTALDNNIKVNYRRTGTNNITVTGSVYEIDDFSNLRVINNILSVISVENFPLINVANGTKLNELNLPASGTLYLSKSTTTSAAITWDDGTPAYNGNIAGTYTFSGTLNVGGNVSNPNDIKARVDVVVAAPAPIDQSAPTGLTGIAPTSSANNDGRITGTTTEMEYKLSSSGTWLAVTAAEITALSAETYNIRYAAKTGFNASPSVNVIVPEYTVKNQAQDAPIGLAGIAPTSTANNDGRITGATTKMEYKLSSSGTWLAVTTAEITGLSAETYNVRYAAKTGFNASPSVNVTVPKYTAPSTGGGSGGGGGSTPSTPPQQQPGNIIVTVNDVAVSAGTETKTTEDGKSTTLVQVNSEVIESKMDEATKNNGTGGANVIQISVEDKDSEVVKVELTGDIIKKLEGNAFTISVKNNDMEYIIPAKEFSISKVAETLNIPETDLKEIKVGVRITKLDERVVEKYKEIAKANGAELVFPPVSFEVVAKITKADGSTGEVKISKFSNYVERVMEIPAGVDPNKITTGIVFNPDGTYSHVPTSVYQEEGKLYARIKSLTNSSYSVIWNPITVKSVENHWSKDHVNDMAARMVIKNPEAFMPDQNITRGDFAEYITKAIGIFRLGVVNTQKFSDVEVTHELAYAIEIASEYGVISGYPDGTFKPDAQISREEAMVMYSKAMFIVGLEEGDSDRINSYTDKDLVADWAYNAIKKTISVGVFNGKTKETINPKDTFTCAEAATAIRNLLVKAGLIND